MTPATKDSPLVSAIIPAFNRNEMLLRAVNSVLSQSYYNIELIVVDDCSTEDTSEVKDLVKSRNHKFISTKTNSGPAHARNLGVENSSGKYIAFLDSDDVWNQDKIKKQVVYHSQNPHIKISQCLETWNRNNKKVKQSKKYQTKYGNNFDQCTKYCCVSPSSVFMEKDLFAEYKGFNEDYRACEDYELWLRISAKYDLGLTTEELTTKNAGHDDQLSKIVPALDKYRLKALVELDPLLLNDSQKEIVALEIQNKANILLMGAKKRGLDTSFYQSLID